MLHRADRHLIYPPGGMEELRRRDPIRVAEEKERQARQRKGDARGADGPPDATVLGLNIRLDTPELIAEWVQQRKRRFPTAKLIEEKAAKRQAIEQRREQRLERASMASKAQETKTTAPPSASASSSDAESYETGSSTSSASSDSDSDMDPERDAVSSKLEPPGPPESASVCKFWVRGECQFGDKCRQRHEGTPHRRTPVDQEVPARKRVAPRPSGTRAFAPPDLLRELLGQEISRHVDALGQWIQFVLDNDMLVHVERRAGDAAMQRDRRARVVVIDSDAVSTAAAHQDAPCEGGSAEAETRRSTALGPSLSESDTGAPALRRAPSPNLRALDELHWPEEPDPLIYKDPLRASDPKPLRHADLLALATDTTIREILQSTSPLYPHGQENSALRRAFETWEALPTPRHREAALQLILGVSSESPVHAHEALLPPSQRLPGAPRKTGMRQHRVIGETELFRLGLRVAPTEVRQIQHLAQRVASLTDGLEYTGSL